MYACQYVNRSICSNFKYLTGKYQQMTTLTVTMPFCGSLWAFHRRQHSSRMCTARLPTVRVSVATTRCQSRGGVRYTHRLYLPPGYTYPPAPGYTYPTVPTSLDTYPHPWRDLVPEIPTPQKGPGTRDTYPYPIPKQIDRHLWKHYLSSTTVAGGKHDWSILDWFSQTRRERDEMLFRNLCGLWAPILSWNRSSLGAERVLISWNLSWVKNTNSMSFKSD